MLKLLNFIPTVVIINFLSVTAMKENIDFTPLNEFSFNLLASSYAEQLGPSGDENVVISPLSVWNLFSLLAVGAEGKTYQELEDVLKLSNVSDVTELLRSTTRSILKGNRDIMFRGQSAMFSDNSLPIRREFCEAAKSVNTDIYSVDTKNPTLLARDINHYVTEATAGKITKVVEPDLLQNLVMILVESWYMKANWTYSFNPKYTTVQPFYNFYGEHTGNVNMMFQKAPHAAERVPELQSTAFTLTFGHQKEYAMIILLPFEGIPVGEVLYNLATRNPNWLTELKAESRSPLVNTFIPRFKLSSQLNIIPILNLLGIESIFDYTKADLPGISSKRLYVSKAIQNVEIEVNEKGALADAATVVELEDKSFSLKFNANREFVFLITQRNTNAVLIAGVYTQPSLV